MTFGVSNGHPVVACAQARYRHAVQTWHARMPTADPDFPAQNIDWTESITIICGLTIASMNLERSAQPLLLRRVSLGVAWSRRIFLQRLLQRTAGDVRHILRVEIGGCRSYVAFRSSTLISWVHPDLVGPVDRGSDRVASNRLPQASVSTSWLIHQCTHANNIQAVADHVYSS